MPKNELTFVDQTRDLTALLVKSIDAYREVSPIYTKLAQTILNKISEEQELNNMDYPTLLKVLELSNKAQMAPIAEFTKLVQALSALQDRNELQKRVAELTAIVNEFTGAREESGYKSPTIINAEMDDDQDDTHPEDEDKQLFETVEE